MAAHTVIAHTVIGTAIGVAARATGRSLWSAVRGVDTLLAAFLTMAPSASAASEEVG